MPSFSLTDGLQQFTGAKPRPSGEIDPCFASRLTLLPDEPPMPARKRRLSRVHPIAAQGPKPERCRRGFFPSTSCAWSRSRSSSFSSPSDTAIDRQSALQEAGNMITRRGPITPRTEKVSVEQKGKQEQDPRQQQGQEQDMEEREVLTEENDLSKPPEDAYDTTKERRDYDVGPVRRAQSTPLAPKDQAGLAFEAELAKACTTRVLLPSGGSYYCVADENGEAEGKMAPHTLSPIGMAGMCTSSPRGTGEYSRAGSTEGEKPAILTGKSMSNKLSSLSSGKRCFKTSFSSTRSGSLIPPDRQPVSSLDEGPCSPTSTSGRVPFPSATATAAAHQSFSSKSTSTAAEDISSPSLKPGKANVSFRSRSRTDVSGHHFSPGHAVRAAFLSPIRRGAGRSEKAGTADRQKTYRLSPYLHRQSHDKDESCQMTLSTIPSAPSQSTQTLKQTDVDHQYRSADAPEPTQPPPALNRVPGYPQQHTVRPNSASSELWLTLQDTRSQLLRVSQEHQATLAALQALLERCLIQLESSGTRDSREISGLYHDDASLPQHIREVLDKSSNRRPSVGTNPSGEHMNPFLEDQVKPAECCPRGEQNQCSLDHWLHHEDRQARPGPVWPVDPSRGAHVAHTYTHGSKLLSKSNTVKSNGFDSSSEDCASLTHTHSSDFSAPASASASASASAPSDAPRARLRSCSFGAEYPAASGPSTHLQPGGGGKSTATAGPAMDAERCSLRTGASDGSCSLSARRNQMAPSKPLATMADASRLISEHDAAMFAKYTQYAWGGRWGTTPG